jgi:hypothetical protein
MAFRGIYLSLGRVFVFALAFCLSFSAWADDVQAEGESFTIRLKDYFVELQGGQRVDLEIHYRYAPKIERADIPDYRAVQILVEDALYGMPGTGPYWEITNKEIVFHLLKAFPQFPKVSSRFDIQPRALLNISRGSTVEYGQGDLKDYTLLTQLDQDAYYQAREGHYNILVPRPFKASLAGLMRRVANSSVNAQDAGGVIFDLPCFPLAGSAYTFSALLDGLKPKGPYSAIVLPEAVGEKQGLTKLASVGSLQGMVKVINSGNNETLKPVAEVSLAAVLGLGEDYAPGPLAEVRERFFTQQASAIVMEEKYARPYQLLKYRVESFATDTKLALFATPASGLRKDSVPKILVE